MLDEDIKIIEGKILRGERLTFEDGLALLIVKIWRRLVRLPITSGKKFAAKMFFTTSTATSILQIFARRVVNFARSGVMKILRARMQ